MHISNPDDEKLAYFKSGCTGALITSPEGVNDHFVLTAAHCFWDRKMTDPDNPDSDFKKWKPEIDRRSFQFGVLKQGRLDGDAADCGIEKVMIPQEYTTLGFPDIAVVKLKGCTPPKYPFEFPEFKVDGTEQPPTKLNIAGYGARRTLEVTPLIFKQKLTNGFIECHGAVRP